MILRPIALFCLMSLAACGTLRPEPRDGAAAPTYPALVPLGAVDRGIDALLARDVAGAGASLEARGADLRRRAALLREMPL